MLIFFTIVLSVYILANLYIFHKGYKSIQWMSDHKILYTVIFTILACLFIAGKILERSHSSVLSDIFNITGGFWLAFMVYAFIFLLLSDILFPVLRLTGAAGKQDAQGFHRWAYILTVTASLLFITGGFINALLPVVRKYDITINKKAGDIKNLRIAAVSDIHLGSVIRKRSMRQLSSMIGSTKADVVLLLGDIVDGEIGPVLRDDLLSYFKCPECKYGLIAITGNHEFIGGASRTIPYIESKGIRILKDETVILPGGIQIIGRIDRDSRMFYGKERKQLDELMKGADSSNPIILLDHQPFNLEETKKHNIDLQLSGHTHNGQMWPLNYITDRVFGYKTGLTVIENRLNFYLLSGTGTWGPPIRLFAPPEILEIELK